MRGASHADLIAQLYTLPLDEFTSERVALAKRLRAEGEREAALQVSALRKPSLTAWALNRLRDRAPERLEELLAAGARLREAQAQVIAAGGRAEFRDAIARERELVEDLVDRAAAELSASGRGPTEAVRSRLFATLHAAAADDEVRALVAAGQLVRDYQVSDLGFGRDLSATSTRRPDRAPSASQSVKSLKHAGRELAVASKRREQSIAAEAKASRELKTAERTRQAAQRALAHAQDRLRQASNAVEHAESVLAAATQELEAARTRHDQARDLAASGERGLAALSRRED